MKLEIERKQYSALHVYRCVQYEKDGHLLPQLITSVIASKGEIQDNVKPLVLLKIALILAISTLFLMSVSSFAQSTSTYGVTNPQGGQPYNVHYTLTGAAMTDMRVNIHDTSLVILMNSTSGGNLVIDLPRSLIDAKTSTGDDQFIVLVDDTYTSFHEAKTSTDRILTIPFSSGSGRIEIIGTQVVPEFGSLSVAILAVSIISILAISTRTRFRFHL